MSRRSPVEQMRLLERIEAEAYAALIAAAPPAFAAAVGLRVTEAGGATLLVAPRIPVALFNRAIGLGVHRPAREEDLDAIRSVYASAGVGEAWIHRCPDAEPAELSAWMEARGLRLAARPGWAKVALEADEAPSVPSRSNPSLAVREIGPEDAATFARLVTAAHGMPPGMIPWTSALVGAPGLRSYLVEEGGVAIGAGLLFLGEAGAWLGLGATATEHRRKGAQGALMVRRIRDAFDAGAPLVTTETGEPTGDEERADNPSLRNMYRHGLVHAYSRFNHALFVPAR